MIKIKKIKIFFKEFIKLLKNAISNENNISEILNDTSKYPSAMLNDRVWNYKYMSVESTVNSAVNFEDMTADALKNRWGDDGYNG